jgi:energy-coupling factor transport system ATP-binding protein
LLVLDEPTFGQDRRTWIELVDLLAGLRDAGHGVVAVTHDGAFVTSLSDRVVELPGTLCPASPEEADAARCSASPEEADAARCSASPEEADGPSAASSMEAEQRRRRGLR